MHHTFQVSNVYLNLFGPVTYLKNRLTGDTAK